MLENEGNEPSTATIVLKQEESEVTDRVMNFSTECTQECKPEKNCTGCRQEIIVRCVSQDCNCSAGQLTDGCKATTTWHNEQ